MKSALELTFRDVSRTPAIDRLIHNKIDKLEIIYDHIISCHLAVERPQRHLKTGNPYRVRLEIRVPHGNDIIATHESGQGDMHLSLETVIRDVFENGMRQLKKLGEKQRDNTKRHLTRDTSGIIIEIQPERDHGFLRAHDGRRVYFHRNSVINYDFDELNIGASVRFEPDMGVEGAHARSVYIIDPRGVRATHRRSK